MKKYIVPTMKVAEIEMEALIADSPTLYNEQGNGSWHSKRHIWDSEDDEEW